MAYNQNIPQPANKLKNSQPQLLANFQEISTLISANHVEFNDPNGNEGKHKFLQMPEQGVDTSTEDDEVAMFAKQGANSQVAELNFRRQLDGVVVPFTECLQDANFWTFVPSGILIKSMTIVVPRIGAGSTAIIPYVWPVAGNIRVFSQPPYHVIAYLAAITSADVDDKGIFPPIVIQTGLTAVGGNISLTLSTFTSVNNDNIRIKLVAYGI